MISTVSINIFGLVLRIGKWSKLPSDVKNFTLEEKLERFHFNERIKQKKHPCDHLVECKKKLLSYKKQKKECESELFSIEIVRTFLTKCFGSRSTF